MAAAVDLGYLAAHLGMPEENLSTIVTQPNIDLVKVILSAVAAKGHEYDVISSQKIQLEVEIETSIRAAEAQRDRSNETATKALKDAEDIRSKLKTEGVHPSVFPWLIHFSSSHCTLLLIFAPAHIQ